MCEIGLAARQMWRPCATFPLYADNHGPSSVVVRQGAGSGRASLSVVALPARRHGLLRQSASSRTDSVGLTTSLPIAHLRTLDGVVESRSACTSEPADHPRRNWPP